MGHVALNIQGRATLWEDQSLEEVAHGASMALDQESSRPELESQCRVKLLVEKRGGDEPHVENTVRTQRDSC